VVGGSLTGALHVFQFPPLPYPSSLAALKYRIVDILIPTCPGYPGILANNEVYLSVFRYVIVRFAKDKMILAIP